MLEHAPRCTHTKITGHLCKSPALKGKNFCYFHQRVYRHVPIPYGSTIEPQFILDNEESIQYAIMETLSAIVRGTMDHKTATLVLRGLNIAVKNCKQNNVCFEHHQNEIVQEVPDYPRQYLQEHPEYDAPVTKEELPADHDHEVDNHEVKIEIEPAQAASEPVPDRRPPASAPSTEAATIQASAAALSTHQSKQWREIRRLQSSFEGARRGNLKDLKTCFHLAGLFPTKPK
jgi:hypothetical protein